MKKLIALLFVVALLTSFAVPSASAIFGKSSGQPAAATETITVSANGYTAEVLSAEKTKDYLGNTILMVKYKFTNNNSASAAFWQATNQTVTQNGRNLSPDGIVCDDPNFMNSYAQVSKGQSVICSYPYPYNGDEELSVTISIFNYSTGITVASSSGTVAIA